MKCSRIILCLLLLSAGFFTLALPLPPLPAKDAKARWDELRQYVSLNGPAHGGPSITNCSEGVVSLPIANLARGGAQEMHTLSLLLPNRVGPVPAVIVVPTAAGVTLAEHTSASLL